MSGENHAGSQSASLSARPLGSQQAFKHGGMNALLACKQASTLANARQGKAKRAVLNQPKTNPRPCLPPACPTRILDSTRNRPLNQVFTTPQSITKHPLGSWEYRAPLCTLTLHRFEASRDCKLLSIAQLRPCFSFFLGGEESPLSSSNQEKRHFLCHGHWASEFWLVGLLIFYVWLT